jgi:hypothetical protein
MMVRIGVYAIPKGRTFQVGEFITIDPDEWIWYM